jgi:hypothetical protein
MISAIDLKEIESSSVDPTESQSIINELEDLQIVKTIFIPFGINTRDQYIQVAGRERSGSFDYLSVEDIKSERLLSYLNRPASSQQLKLYKSKTINVGQVYWKVYYIIYDVSNFNPFYRNDSICAKPLNSLSEFFYNFNISIEFRIAIENIVNEQLLKTSQAL